MGPVGQPAGSSGRLTAEDRLRSQSPARGMRETWGGSAGQTARASGKDRAMQSATGTDDMRPSRFAPKSAPNPDKQSKSGAIPVKMARQDDQRDGAGSLAVSACHFKRKSPLTFAVNGPSPVETSGLEPPTPGLQSRCSPN